MPINPNPKNYLGSKFASLELCDKINSYYASRGYPDVKAYVVEETNPNHWAVRINVVNNVDTFSARIVGSLSEMG